MIYGQKRQKKSEITKMARQQQDVDVLFDVRNAFFIGNYQQCINDAQKLKINDPEIALERDALLYRAFIAQKNYRLVQNEITASSNPKLQPLKLLAQYLANPSAGHSIVATIEEKVSKGVDLSNELFLIVATTIYYHENNLEGALRVLNGAESLEALAYGLQVLLALNRPDLARRQLKLMQDKDDDATLTQLAQAWLHLVQGGAKLQDAYYICEELSDKFGAGPALGAALVATHAGRGGWVEAEGAALEAITKDPNAPDLMLATAVVSLHLGKPEVTNRYLSQMLVADQQQKHPFVTAYQSKEEEFRRLTAQYKPSVLSSFSS